MEKSRLIWVVDDDDIFQFIADRYIRMHFPFYRVDIFREGEEAFSKLMKKKDRPDQIPDYILLDLSMPNWDGYKFLQEFNQVRPALKKIPVIKVVSTTYNEMDMQVIKDNPAVSDFWLKPLNTKQISQLNNGNVA